MSQRVSTLDAVIAAAREADLVVHRSTAHGIKAIGIGLAGSLFDRAAHTFAEQVAGSPAAAGNSVEEILERGHFDMQIDGGRFTLRVVANE